MGQPLLQIRNLKTCFESSEGPVLAVDDVSFSIHPGETVGVVGESGCGKSATALSVLRLIPEPPGKIAGGEIHFRGKDLLALPEADLRKIRGNQISMVFQDPMTALNPVYRVGSQVAEAIRIHRGADRKTARARAVEMLRQVGIPAPEQRADSYPHQLSGGMRQRVMIAMALACDPDLLIADEPTTALDVTIQAQILELISAEQQRRQMAVMLITHDLGVVAETCSRVVVMYAGRVVEEATVDKLFSSPAHPYSAGLMRSIPRIEPEPPPSATAEDRSVSIPRLPAIPGMVPSLSSLPQGCRFRDRCDRALPVCAEVEPTLALKRDGQLAACHNPVPVPSEVAL